MKKYKGSTSVDLNVVEEVNEVNTKNAVQMLITYLKIKEGK